MHAGPLIDQDPRQGPAAEGRGDPGDRPAEAAGWRWWLFTAAMVALAAGLRLRAARGDLWLDEIWSLELAREAGSLGRVLFGLHHDNNHHLNTAWLLFVGEGASPLAYRLLAVAPRGAPNTPAALRPLRLGRRAAAFWMVLLAGSFLLVQYGSEARGYAPAALFAVLDLYLLDRYLATRGRWWAAAFAASSVLGLLSHLTFLHVLLGLLAWAALALLQERRRCAPDPLAAALLASPLGVLGLLWLLDLRFLAVGGGPEYRLLEVLRELGRATLATPRGPVEVLGLVAAAAAAHEVWRLARERRPEWVLFAVAVVAAPAALVAITRPAYLAPRYFLLAVPFLLLLLAMTLDRLARQGTWGKAACAALLLAFAAGSWGRAEQLATVGRGRYREAVEYLLRASPSGPVTVGSDHDFRNGGLLSHYARVVPGGRSFVYLPADRWTARDPEWVLLHDLSHDPHPSPRISAWTGRSYELVRQFPYYGLSGWHWYLYRMEGVR